MQNAFSFSIPQIFWNAGCQLVALNYQTPGNGIFHLTLAANKVGLRDLVNQKTVLQAPVPGKPISVNRGLNRLNPGIKFILRLISVPESTISTIQRINQGLNLTHLERSMNSLIGE